MGAVVDLVTIVSQPPVCVAVLLTCRVGLVAVDQGKEQAVSHLIIEASANICRYNFIERMLPQPPPPPPPPPPLHRARGPIEISGIFYKSHPRSKTQS